MRLDVPIVFDAKPKAHGLPSVGVSRSAPPRVAIKSSGMLTVFGDAQQTWKALLKGQSIDDHMRLPSVGGDGRALQLAHAVTRFDVNRDAALVLGTSKGSIEQWFTAIPTVGLGEIAYEVGRRLGLNGPTLTLSAACASGLHALIRGAMMIQSGEVRQALIVATEASVHPLFLGSFQRLGVLARPGEGCRPFDRRRTGFYMTEAAAAVLLEAEESNGSDGHSVCVERFAFGGDATHLTAGDPTGTVLKHLLSKVIDGRPVDLIHAHGTGTVLNDETELAAIDATVGDWPQRPVVYSHKAALGHSLGASGLLSIVLNQLAHNSNEMPPNPRTTDPLPAGRVIIPSVPTRRPVRRSVAIAAGFGGPTAVVSLASEGDLPQ